MLSGALQRPVWQVTTADALSDVVDHLERDRQPGSGDLQQVAPHRVRGQQVTSPVHHPVVVLGGRDGGDALVGDQHLVSHPTSVHPAARDVTVKELARTG